MTKVNPSAVEKVLAGDIQALCSAFAWSQTPQGVQYWSDRARGAIPLSEEDIKTLKIWLRIQKGESEEESVPVSTHDKWDPQNWGV